MTFFFFISAISCAPDYVRFDGDTDNAAADADADVDVDADADADSDISYDTSFDTEEWICDQSEFNIQMVNPDMLIVLDRSNSMAPPPEGEGHWDPVRQAIYDVTEELDHALWFGLMVFPNSLPPGSCYQTVMSGSDTCAAPTRPVVEVGPRSSGDIRSALESMDPCGGTPTADTLEAARTYLESIQLDRGHPMYVILATDGGPNCNDGLDAWSCTCTLPDDFTGEYPDPGEGCMPYAPEKVTLCLDDARTYAVVDELHDAGITLFVVGINASHWTDVMNEMARRGGTGTALMAEDPQRIREIFAEVTGLVQACEFEVGELSPTADPSLVNFFFDGEPVPMYEGDAASCDEGWVWMDEAHTRFKFCGEQCDMVALRQVSWITATWGCPTLI